MEAEMEQTQQFRGNHGNKKLPERLQQDEVSGLRANVHACRSSQWTLQHAGDRLRRANRDLGELAAFIAASLTTVTAIEAVINIAVGKVGLEPNILQLAFDLYIGFLAGIFILGALRFLIVMRRRARAEKEMDRAKRGIYEFCPTEDWTKLRE
jgi:hypothetical protein